MSLKACLNFVPQTLKLLNSTKVLFIRPEFTHFQPGILTCNKINLKYYSTTASPVRTKIYYGVLTPQIKAVKIFSLSSSFVGIISQPFLYREIVSTGNVPIIVAAYSFIGFFTLLTPILLHFITKKYVTLLEYKEDTGTYVASTVNFFCRTKETEFTPEQVTAPDVPGMFTTIIANGKPLFVDPRMFDRPDHYAKIMGYDKPIDFKLYDTPTNDKKD